MPLETDARIRSAVAVMQWVGFGILGLATILLQVRVAPLLEWHGMRPDWVLVLIVFYTLHTRGLGVVAGAWMLGLAMDLQSLERQGLVALSYAVAALLVVEVRGFVVPRNLSSQTIVTLFPAICVQAIWLIYRGVVHGGSTSGWLAMILSAAGAAVYTAAFAPLLHSALLAVSKPLGLKVRRSRR